MKTAKPCPFCGCIPEANGDIVTHRSESICIVDNTQYDLEKWNYRYTDSGMKQNPN